MIKCSEQGTSLLELIVAIAILGAVLLPITQAFPYSAHIINSAKRSTTASYLAQEKIEEIFSLGYAGAGINIVEARTAMGASGTYLSNFERETEIRYVDENLQNSITDTGLKKITSAVYYYSPITNNEKSFAISTLMVEK